MASIGDDKEPPLPPDDSQRVYLRALAELWGWPDLYIGRGRTVLAGEANWLTRTFRGPAPEPVARAEGWTARRRSLLSGFPPSSVLSKQTEQAFVGATE